MFFLIFHLSISNKTLFFLVEFVFCQRSSLSMKIQLCNLCFIVWYWFLLDSYWVLVRPTIEAVGAVKCYVRIFEGFGDWFHTKFSFLRNWFSRMEIVNGSHSSLTWSWRSLFWADLERLLVKAEPVANDKSVGQSAKKKRKKKKSLAAEELVR